MGRVPSTADIDIWEAAIPKTRPDYEKRPRPQAFLWSFDLMSSCLLFLTATFFILTIYSILQANVDSLPDGMLRFLSLKVLDTSSAASLFVTLLGALLVRHQFALSLLPRINYKSALTTRKESVHPDSSFETWRVEIRNSGLGAAIITSTSYALAIQDQKENSGLCSHPDIVSELNKLGLARNADYWLANLTTGFALSPKDDYVVFEIKKEHLAKLERLDMVLYFQSQLGGKYWREIFLIPPQSVRPDHAGQNNH